MLDSPIQRLLSVVLKASEVRTKWAALRSAASMTLLLVDFPLKSEATVQSALCSAPTLPPTPTDVKRASRQSRIPSGAATLHALAHIEVNAVHLYADTMLRFWDCLGPSRVSRALQVAADEARHFDMLCERMTPHGLSYGSLPVHGALWQDAVRSSTCLLARIAVLALVQEARALDVHSRLKSKFIGSGDMESAAAVEQICSEEVAHVAAGVEWFNDFAVVALAAQRRFKLTQSAAHGAATALSSASAAEVTAGLPAAEGDAPPSSDSARPSPGFHCGLEVCRQLGRCAATTADASAQLTDAQEHAQPAEAVEASRLSSGAAHGELFRRIVRRHYGSERPLAGPFAAASRRRAGMQDDWFLPLDKLSQQQQQAASPAKLSSRATAPAL